MNIDFESRNITRRSFLKGAGVVGAAGLLSACGGSMTYKQVQQLRQHGCFRRGSPQLYRCHSPQGVYLLGVCQP